MKTIFKRTSLLTNDEKKKVSDMTGKIMLHILEGRNIRYMSEKLNLHPFEIEYNIDEALYTLRRQVGLKRYLKILFFK